MTRRGKILKVEAEMCEDGLCEKCGGKEWSEARKTVSEESIETNEI